MKDQLDLLTKIENRLPKHSMREEEKKSSVSLIFDKLEEREKACLILAEESIRFRTGKRLVPYLKLP